MLDNPFGAVVGAGGGPFELGPAPSDCGGGRLLLTGMVVVGEAGGGAAVVDGPGACEVDPGCAVGLPAAAEVPDS